jgi:methionyl-tRNA formyltransferase
VSPEENIEPLRLVLMGTGPFAVPSFEALQAAGHEIALVVTKPSPAVKSRKGPPPNPVRQWAMEYSEGDNSCMLLDPPSINSEFAIERVAAEKADLLVVCDYGQILKPAALATARLGGINLHGSLLPKYRGAAPVQRSLLNGDAETGVSVIHMTPKLDGGPILCTRSTAITNTETAGELEARLSQMGVQATLEAVALLQDWDGQSTIGSMQDPALITKAPRLCKAEAEIDWSKSTRQIDCLVRGMQPWPIAFTHIKIHDNKPPLRLAIKRIAVDVALPMPEDAIAGDDVKPGTIVSVANGLIVATGDGVVEIGRLQPAGKRDMDASEFVRGHHLTPGMMFVAK